MTTIKNITSILFLTLVLLVGCKKDTDFPPVKVLPEGNIITIDSLRNIYTAFDSIITDDISVYGIVTADATTGNIYKELFIQDETNAIKLGLTSSSDYLIGDKIRVALKGATVTRDNNMILVDNIDPDASIVKQASNLDLTPEVVTLTDIALSGLYSPYQAKLVQINDVEFVCADVCNTWANAISQSDENRDLSDTSGNIVIVRSSGYATFAGQSLPMGQGSIIAVVTQFGSFVQLTIRNPNELTLYGTRKTTCSNCPFYSKNFDDGSLTSGGWVSQNVVGLYDWTIGTIGGSYAQISNYNSGNTASEAWLISPAFDLSATTSPVLEFRNAYNFSGTALALYVTTNYTGDATTTAWTDITSSATWSTGGFAWASSGNISLLAYQQPGVRFAFKYIGGTTSGSTWEIDDFNLTDL